ncbi:SDR family NAD(P)-dependent oxidoreductase [Leifsonia sp. C5G2]|jgi:3alpha(or 20beta)-hydroxysteroid dehydrogenase|uniref:SDR family NAD(P)-dependent oxidoreductase n=1 Tax=Leifsonia sp. C5G2 TaxID=2735269 RepID=UPI0015853F0C|nr:SDR family NAD(P)-dependent oxidoreductase [Leifsonia sp. C5G2]NUU08460.1 SDR family oxidoreductase [Leifsonia sp. C5G2]
MTTLSGKRILVVGAGGAQGSVGARLFAEQGAHVVVADAVQEAAETVAGEIRATGGTAVAAVADVGDADSWTRLVELATAEFGGLDGMVNYAAILSRAGAADTEIDVFERTIHVNLTGAWFGIRAVVPALLAAGGGSIVTIGSVDGLVGRGGGAAYQASKGGVRLLTKSVATEFASRGIRANSVHPGPMKTRMAMVVGPKADPAGVQELEVRLTAQVPMARLGQPIDIAYAVRYLLSDESSFVTGVDLPVDGGLTAQ